MSARHFAWWCSGACFVTIVVLLIALVMLGHGSSDYDRPTAAKADLRALATQLDVYKHYNGSYPTNRQTLDALVTRPTSSPVPEHWIQHLRELPIDPWQHPYVYRYPSSKDPNTFDLFSLGPDGVESSDDIWLPR
jgi:general secretion pathway protein G